MTTAILFDLDGTLSDPKEGIVGSYRAVLAAFGLPDESPDTLARFIGPPLRDVFRHHYGLSGDDVERAVKAYRAYYDRQGLYENRVYPGVETMLETLRAKGYKLIVATSKVAVYAERILEHFRLKQYFDFVSGCEMNGKRSKKTEVIAYALEQCGLTAADCYMVGDREYDITAALELGLTPVAALYGYGSREESQTAGAQRFAETPSEIIDRIQEGIA